MSRSYRVRNAVVIEFKSVSKLYPDGTRAVDDFSAVLPSRQTTVFVGSSGCGKTTLLRMINRMVDPTAGAIEIDGDDIARTEPVHLRRRIGYVMQNSGLLPHRKVLDNVATVLFLTKVPRAQAYERAYELLDTVGLDRALANRYPGELSGGQQQRVGVARGLAADPNILLMDEPFGAVDPIVRTDLQAETMRLQRELNKTIVFVTHDIDEAFLLGDQVIILEKGRRSRSAEPRKRSSPTPRATSWRASSERIAASAGSPWTPRSGRGATTSCSSTRAATRPESSPRPTASSPSARRLPSPAASRTRPRRRATPNGLGMEQPLRW